MTSLFRNPDAPKRAKPEAQRCLQPGCGAWGIFGFRPPNYPRESWWCGDHKHLGAAERIKPGDAPRLAKGQAQGALFSGGRR